MYLLTMVAVFLCLTVWPPYNTYHPPWCSQWRAAHCLARLLSSYIRRAHTETSTECRHSTQPKATFFYAFYAHRTICALYTQFLPQILFTIHKHTRNITKKNGRKHVTPGKESPQQQCQGGEEKPPYSCVVRAPGRHAYRTT